MTPLGEYTCISHSGNAANYSTTQMMRMRTAAQGTQNHGWTRSTAICHQTFQCDQQTKPPRRQCRAWSSVMHTTRTNLTQTSPPTCRRGGWRPEWTANTLCIIGPLSLFCSLVAMLKVPYDICAMFYCFHCSYDACADGNLLAYSVSYAVALMQHVCRKCGVLGVLHFFLALFVLLLLLFFTFQSLEYWQKMYSA